MKNGHIETSPLKRGAPGDLLNVIFELICNTFETLMRINQFNVKGEENSCHKLCGRINRVLGNDKKVLSFKMLYRVLVATAIDLATSKSDSVEERRILWTSYKN